MIEAFRASVRHILDRTGGFALDPRDEWARVVAEGRTLTRTDMQCGALFICLPALAYMARVALFGNSVSAFLVRPTLGEIVLLGVAQFLMSCVAFAMIAAFADFVLGQMSERSSPALAVKLSLYAMMPYWLASLVTVFPGLGAVPLLAALYSAWILFIGLVSYELLPTERLLIAIAAIILPAIALLILAQAMVEPIAGVHPGSAPVEQVGIRAGIAAV